MGSRQIVLISTAGFSVLDTEIFWREAKTKRLFSQCRFDLNIFFLQVFQPVVSTVPMGIPAIRAESVFSRLLCAQENPTFYQCRCTVTRLDVIFRYTDWVPLTHFVHRAKQVFALWA